MKFFHPQIQLARESVFDQPDIYFLHVVTFCPRTSFRADGFAFDDSALADNLYKVIVKLRQDPALPDYEYITPVVHTLALGSIAFPDGEGDIQVQVQGVALPRDSGGSRDVDPPTQTGGTGTVGTTTAEDKSRPIDSNAL